MRKFLASNTLLSQHVHLELSFMGQYSEPPESGTRCAIAGGTVRDLTVPNESIAGSFSDTHNSILWL